MSHLCMYVCMYVCMYACMNIGMRCMHIYVHLFIRNLTKVPHRANIGTLLSEKQVNCLPTTSANMVSSI